MVMDSIGNIRRIQNKDVNETFTQTTDSLEAIRDFLSLISTGLIFYGTVDAVPGANQFTINALAGQGAGKFTDANAPFWVFVYRDAGGASAAPQGEQQTITAYVTGTGTFTTNAFTAAVAVGDEILIIHPDIISAVPGADSIFNVFMRHVIGNKTDTAIYAPSNTASIIRYLKGLFGAQILATGTITTSSTTVPADNTRTEANDHWNGCLLMPITGACAFQPRQIVTYALAGGVFTLGGTQPFAALPGLVEYVILAAQDMRPHTADSGGNTTSAHVIGNKADTATQTIAATASLMRYIKGMVDALITANGVTAWLARSLPNNGVSLSEAIRYTAELKPEYATPVATSYTTVTAAEETILTTAYTVPGEFLFNLTLRNMVVGDEFTIRVYRRVDGANYDLADEQIFVGNPVVKIFSLKVYVDSAAQLRVTVQRISATNRAFPYNYSFIRQPVA